MLTGALAAALTFAAPAAEAGPACNRIGIGSPCIKSNDLKARLNLDEEGRDARLRLRDADGANAVELDARSFNVTNFFANAENQSNGLVKAWAQINFDGTIQACWRCNTDPDETGQIAPGFYTVDFTPLATDITGRPRTAIGDAHVAGEIGGGACVFTLADLAADASSVLVAAQRSDTLEPANCGFGLVIY